MQDYKVSQPVAEVFSALLADKGIQNALEFLKNDHEFRIKEVKEMALIHGESYKEHLLRSPMFKAKMEQYGAKDCVVDAEGNPIGYVYGSAGASARPKVLCEAHIDTVFTEDTPLAITEKNGRLYCPGIADNTMGMSMVLAVLRAIQHANLKPVGTIMMAGTVGEEAKGQSRGIRALVRDHLDMDAAIAVDRGHTERITRGAVAVKRYELTFSGPGGHSWHAFGLPSPTHAMGRAMAKIADLRTSTDPKTTFNIGIVGGGTAVNAITDVCSMHVDMRSLSQEELNKLDAQILALADQAVAEENLFRAKEQRISVSARAYGAKPGGDQPTDSLMVQAAWAATATTGVAPVLSPPSSTNTNIPLSIGMPALCIGGGGIGLENHSLNEWLDPAGSWTAPQKALLFILSLTGLEGVTKPLIGKFTRNP